MLRVVNPFIYQRILEESMRNPSIPCYLHESYSQCYEDTILDGLVRAYLARHKSSIRDIAYLDIGANHPVATSNTYLLHIFHGICGILVEANPDLIGELKRFRPHDQIIHAAVTVTDESYVTLYIPEKNELSSVDRGFLEVWGDIEPIETISVPTVRVMDLLNKLRGKQVILSIDIEGLDREILEDIDFAVTKPFAIVVEHGEQYDPSNSDAIMEFLISHNYFLYAKTNVNLIFSLF